MTNLFQNGKIVTTEAKAKEVRRIAEHYITLAVNECDNTVTTTKITHNDKDQKVELQVVNDAPSKLHARRQMTAYLYNVPQQKLADENKKEYRGAALCADRPCDPVCAGVPWDYFLLSRASSDSNRRAIG